MILSIIINWVLLIYAIIEILNTGTEITIYKGTELKYKQIQDKSVIFKINDKQTFINKLTYMPCSLKENTMGLISISTNFSRFYIKSNPKIIINISKIKKQILNEGELVIVKSHHLCAVFCTTVEVKQIDEIDITSNSIELNKQATIIDYILKYYLIVIIVIVVIIILLIILLSNKKNNTCKNIITKIIL